MARNCLLPSKLVVFLDSMHLEVGVLAEEGRIVIVASEVEVLASEVEIVAFQAFVVEVLVVVLEEVLQIWVVEVEGEAVKDFLRLAFLQVLILEREEIQHFLLWPD